MQKKCWVIALGGLGLLGCMGVVQAEPSAAKKELIAKVLLLQQPAIESMARAMAEQPAMQMMQQASMVLQSRVAPDKREALTKDIQADLKKYVDEAVPVVRDRAIKLAPSTVGVLLDEKFSEEELKQVIAIIESPVNRKFQQLGGDMQKLLQEKLVAETRGVIDPKVKALDQAIGKRLGIEPPARAASK
jgi:uncharacterized protein